MKPIVLVVGARPNFMKIAPLLREFGRRGNVIPWKLVHTGQHNGEMMSQVFFDQLAIPNPDVLLDCRSTAESSQLPTIMRRFGETCDLLAPRMVVVVGDVDSTLACALVASRMNITLAHVEAGLRSGDRTMPEETNRIVTDALSDLLFATEQSAVDNLICEGQPEERIHLVGHVMIDNLFFELSRLPHRNVDAGVVALKERLGRYGILTLHRPSNVDSPEALRRIAAILNQVAEQIPLVFPVHPRTRGKLLSERILLAPAVHMSQPLPYAEFLFLMKDAQVVLTDSGGIQEETTALGIPCLTLRENTERPITVDEGSNEVVGLCAERITQNVARALGPNSKRGRCPALWDGKAAERIADVLYSVA